MKVLNWDKSFAVGGLKRARLNTYTAFGYAHFGAVSLVDVTRSFGVVRHSLGNGRRSLAVSTGISSM